MKRLTYLFILIIFIACAATKNDAQDNEVQVVLLSGQSNMVGHGNYDALDESIKKRIAKISDRVLLSSSKGDAKPLSYYTLNGKKYNFDKHFGPELFVGLTLAEKFPKKKFLLIKKAVGGTSLYGAWNPNWNQEKSNASERGEVRKKLKLFSAHINNIQRNLNNLKEKGIKFKILGALWLQGESDTNKEITATSYQENLTNLIAAYRTKLSFKEMPFVIGQVNPLPRKYKTGPKQVREAMLAVAKADDKVAIIETTFGKPWNDFPKHSDNLHYKTEGQKRLGIAFANKLQILLKK